MSERKYRQRGYQDEGRDRGRPRQDRPEGSPRPSPATGRAPRGTPPDQPRRPNMPGFREVVRCARCGNVLSPPIGFETRCPRCGADLHSCAQCASFDTGSRFECMQPIDARISPKDARNACTLFEARVTVERETHSESAAPNSARKAFDDLFKF
jgi:hypothetical protein